MGENKYIFQTKMTACCGNSKTVHVNRAIKFSRRIDICYDFFGKIYVLDLEMKIYCAKCEQKFLYFGRKHNSNNKIVSVTVCTECNRNWSYHMIPGCKNKYEKIIAISLCVKTAKFLTEKETTYPFNVVYLY